MNNQQALNYAKSVFASIESFLFLCNSSLLNIQATERNLSISGFSNLQTAKLCTLRINHLVHIFNYLTTPHNPNEKTNLSNLELGTLMENLCAQFQDTLFEHSLVFIQHYTNSKTSDSILVDKSKFELMILNLLHCSVNDVDASHQKAPQITAYVTETKNTIVFHIRNSSMPLGSDFVNSAFSIASPDCDYVLSKPDILALNLAVAYKSASEMNGRIKYTPLKSGNRFDIYLPKVPLESSSRFYTRVPYVPNSELFLETMADIILESILKKESEASE